MAGQDVGTVGVAGAGTMGCGIAQLCAQNGLEVQLYDLSEEVLAGAEARILKGLERIEAPSAFSLVRKTTDLEAFRACDFVIEAAPEDIRVKQGLFARLDAVAPASCVLATNTSSLSVARIAESTENPGRVIGLHFFNPATVMRLVEIVRAPFTEEETARAASALAKRLGKTAVFCKDTPGFIANRVARPYYLVAARLLQNGAGSPDVIDATMRREGKLRMGPFELMDLIGLDVNLAISKAVYEGLGRPERLRPSELQEALVKRGNLGRKNSRGFYVYDGGSPGRVNPVLEEIVPGMGSRPMAGRDIFRSILGGVVEEAQRALKEGVASAPDIDTAMRLGLNWPKGPLQWTGAAR